MQEVRILINREPFNSPTPTTGRALYELGEIGQDRELFREDRGDHEDALVRRDATEIHLKEDEHFYSERLVTIIIEGTPHRWPEDQMISYDQVVKLEVPNYPDGKTYAVKYSHGPVHYRDGVLTPGGKVKVREGMIFNVSETGQS